MNVDEIKRYWETRAADDPSSQSTTQDHFLRSIEARSIMEQIRARGPKRVADIGCGDARTTGQLADTFPDVLFEGMDYSASMIGNAQRVVSQASLSNLTLSIADVLEPLPLKDPVDLAYTSRCLINLPGWDLQKQAISNIRDAVRPNGYYVMVENFVEGQANFNEVRESFGLPAIGIRDHNTFFERDRLIEFLQESFDVEFERNISSTYYLVSRVIYSKLCEDSNESPDYFDKHHEYAAGLPFAGEYGPVRMLVLRRK
ncbi:SAM-dependent methyltransferase [Amorphus suaedae]